MKKEIDTLKIENTPIDKHAIFCATTVGPMRLVKDGTNLTIHFDDNIKPETLLNFFKERGVPIAISILTIEAAREQLIDEYINHTGDK